MRIVGGRTSSSQARQAFANVGAVLAAAGCSFADVAKVTIFLTDVDDRPLINPVRQELFGGARPASTLVEVSRLAIPGAKIEVEAVAVVPADELHAAITWVDEPPEPRPGPLAGKRLLVKDLIDTAGIRTTYGSSIYADHVPDGTAAVVQRLVDAGACSSGRRTCTSSPGA